MTVLTVLNTATDSGNTTAGIARAGGLTPKQVVKSCGTLLRRGFVGHIENGRYRINPSGRELLRAGNAVTSGPNGPTGHRENRQTLRERLWRALSLVRKATIPELLDLAAAGVEKNANNNARKYLIALERSGYVIRMGRRIPGTSPTSNGFVRWFLVKESGPKAPVYCGKKHIVFDPNTNEEVSVSCQSRGPNCCQTQSRSTGVFRR